MAKRTPAADTPIDPTARLGQLTINGLGPQPARLMLVGEAPVKQDEYRKQPLSSAGGQLLTAILEQKCKPALRRDEMYVTTVVKRRVLDAYGKDTAPNAAEVQLFANTLRAEYHKTQPDVVVTVGATAAKFFLPGCNLELQHGMPTVSEEFGVCVVPCYSPAMAMFDTELMPALYWDCQRVSAFVNGQLGLHCPTTKRTVAHDRLPDDTRPFRDAQGYLHLGVDTEDLVNGRPWCLTVSWADGHACFMPPDHPQLRVLDALVRDPMTITFIHNGMHDLKPLRYLGLDWRAQYRWQQPDGSQHTLDSRIIDTMILAFQQGRLHTQALKTLSYRLLDTLMVSYSDIVDPVAEQRALDYMTEAYSRNGWLKPEHTAYWDEALGKVRMQRPQGVAQRLKRFMSDYGKFEPDEEGNAFSVVKRWEALPAELQQEIEIRLGPFPRTDLSHCDRQAAVHYACQDADQTRLLGLELWARHQMFGLQQVAAIDHGQVPMVERMQHVGLPANSQYFRDLGVEMRGMQEACAGALSVLLDRPINPNSSEQIAELLYKEMGLTAAKMTKTGKQSTGKKALEHLRADNLYVDLIATSKEYGKIDSSFCGNIATRTEWTYPDLDFMTEGELQDEDRLAIAQHQFTAEERAYYQLMITRAKTGRLASKEFNALAIPTRTELGRRIRYGFKTRPGRLLGTWDLNQIEMRVMAHRAQDPQMLEVYNRSPKQFEPWDRDLHIYTANKVTGIATHSMPKKWRTACKSTGFGIIMGITGIGLADQMRMYGLDPEEWTEDRCDEFIVEWLKVFKGVDTYQRDKRAEARRTGEVRDMFGRRFLLPHASCPLQWIASEAERQSHALDIQSSAQCIEKLGMRRIDTEVLPAIRSMGWYIEPCLQVHDELIFEFDAEAADVVDGLMLDALTSVVRMSVPIEAGSAMADSWGGLEK